MRIWDLPPEILCRQHLLGEHRELHALWSVIVFGKSGYAHHPETMRWRGKLAALFARHELLVDEMERRGYQHNSPLDADQATGATVQNELVDTPEQQQVILRSRGCDCRV